MRKFIVISMMTLDGVIQGPGAPGEDPENGFEYCGWIAPYGDERSGEVMKKLMKPSDILLGRKTFEIWENYWPIHEPMWPGINDVTKYVLSSTRNNSEWNNSVFLKDTDAIKKLKNSEGSDIQIWGSSEVVKLLLKNDLADELWLMIHPLTLGQGKKIFDEGPIPAAFTMIENIVTTDGVILAHYRRAGEVKTGTVGEK